MKHKIIFVLIVVLAGSGALAYQEGIINKPQFGMVDRGDWGEVGEDSAEVRTELWIDNDNPAEVKLQDLKASYLLSLNGKKVAEGQKKRILIEQGNQTKTLNTRINAEELEDWWVSHLRRNERSEMVVEGSLDGSIGPVPVRVGGITYSDSLETDIEGMMDNAVGEMKQNYSYNAFLIRPEIQVKGGSAEFGEVSRSKTPIIFRINLHNPNDYPIPKPRTTGSLTMNNIELAEWDEESQKTDAEDQVIEPDETEEIEFRAGIENQKIGDWMLSHIDRGERTQGEMSINMLFEVQGYSFEVPGGEGISCRFDIQTAMLEDGQRQETKFRGCTLPNENLGKSGSGQENQDQNDSGEQLGDLLG